MPDCENFGIGKVWKVDVLGSISGVAETVQTYHLRYDGILVPHTLAQAITDVADWVDDLYALVKLFCNAVTTWDKYKVSGLGEVCVSGEVGIATPIVGSLTNDPVPSGVAGLISFSTNFKRVGLRKYFGALDEGSIGGSGNIGSSTTSDMVDVKDFLLAQYTAGSGRRYTYGYQSPAIGGFVAPNGGIVRQIPAYQRRRRQGVGS